MIALVSLLLLANPYSDMAPGHHYSPPRLSEGLGDPVFCFDAEGPTGDYQIVGVEFDGTYFYLSAGNSENEPNRIYVFDATGNLLSRFDQPSTSDWGFRDLAFDGQYFYGSGNNRIYKFDGQGNFYGYFNGPLNPHRGLAYDPGTDHFWVANRDSKICEITRTGQVLRQCDNDYSTYGLAFDTLSPGSPWLWVSAQELVGQEIYNKVYQFDPRAGTYTGVSFDVIVGGTPCYAAGLCFVPDWDTNKAVVVEVLQGDFDMVAGLLIEERSGSGKDVGVLAVTSPDDYFEKGADITPQGMVINWSSENLDVPTRCEIRLGGSVVYSEDTTLYGLAGRSAREVGFPDVTLADGGVYSLKVFTRLEGDEDRTNDTVALALYCADFIEDFELSDGGLVADPGQDAWEWGVPGCGPGQARSGFKLWATVLDTNYANRANWKLEKEYLCRSAPTWLLFWHWYDMESYWDGSNVKLSTDGGSTWQVIRPVGDYPEDMISPLNHGVGGEPGYSGATSGYQKAYFDLTGLVTPDVSFNLRFHFGSDDENTVPGWYIDDIGGVGFDPDVVGTGEAARLPDERLEVRMVGSKVFFQGSGSLPVRVRVFDLSGRVAALPGKGETVCWNTANSAPGVYFYLCELGQETVTGKLVIR